MLISQLIQIGAAAATASFGLCALIVCSQKWHGRLSHDYDLAGVQKVHTTAVPRIGGLAVITAIFSVLCLFGFVYPDEIIEANVHRILLLLCAALPAFIAGIVEDISKRVSPRVRLSATVCSALLASALLGATVDEVDIWGIDALLTIAPVAIIVTAVIVAGAANAINIIDGFNGLSGSMVAIMSAALGAIAWQVGDTFIVTLCALGAGASIGFLLLNYPSGKLFLGDGGAYFLGFWVAETAVLLLVRNSTVNAWQLLSICAYPVIEVLFTIYRRRVIKKVNADRADALHLHTLIFRRLVRRLVSDRPDLGWARNAAVAFLIVPTIAVTVVASIVAAQTIIGGVLMVLVQVILYILVYNRLVRGKWPRANKSISHALDTESSLEPS
jgi:UDP-N-acetylmuramyl pentapeptide phosphotransferase/UDP-N-acetylglucosamine-1-phosphate transferase